MTDMSKRAVVMTVNADTVPVDADVSEPGAVMVVNADMGLVGADMSKPPAVMTVNADRVLAGWVDKHSIGPHEALVELVAVMVLEFQITFTSGCIGVYETVDLNFVEEKLVE